jgi:uncharacterized protein YuzE
VNWHYDEGGDVLYVSVGEPVQASGLDIGDGIIVRYKEETGEVVGLTIIGLKERSLAAIGKGS